jgi:hypothetical protein
MEPFTREIVTRSSVRRGRSCWRPIAARAIRHANESALEMLRMLLAKDGYSVDAAVRGTAQSKGGLNVRPCSCDHRRRFLSRDSDLRLRHRADDYHDDSATSANASAAGPGAQSRQAGQERHSLIPRVGYVTVSPPRDVIAVLLVYCARSPAAETQPAESVFKNIKTSREFPPAGSSTS